jgi:hypothetical protein
VLAWMVVEFGEHEMGKKTTPSDSIHKKDSVKKDSAKMKPLSRD